MTRDLRKKVKEISEVLATLGLSKKYTKFEFVLLSDGVFTYEFKGEGAKNYVYFNICYKGGGESLFAKMTLDELTDKVCGEITYLSFNVMENVFDERVGLINYNN